jgi:hypothetical protein
MHSVFIQGYVGISVRLREVNKQQGGVNKLRFQVNPGMGT